jgi:hypothetical protein
MLTPQHSFGSISQRNRCVLLGNARGANDDLRRRCAYAICKTSRAHWRISIGARILRCAHSRMALATMSRIASSRRRSRSCLLSGWKRSNNAQRVACLPAVPVFLFEVWGSSKPPSRSPAPVRNALFEAPNGLKRLTVSARFSIAVRLFRPARLRPIDPRSGVARVGSNAARTPPFPARCAFPIHCG